MDLDKLQLAELKTELSRRGEDARGSKAVLKERLQQILKEEAFQAASQPQGIAEDESQDREESPPDPDRRKLENDDDKEGGADADSSDKPKKKLKEKLQVQTKIISEDKTKDERTMPTRQMKLEEMTDTELEAILRERHLKKLKKEGLKSKDKEDDAGSHRGAMSVASSSSSVASARAMELAKLAGLTAKKEALKKKHELQEQEARLRRMMETLDVEAEINESEAREKVFGEMMGLSQPQETAVLLQEAPANPQDGVDRWQVTAVQQNEENAPVQETGTRQHDEDSSRKETKDMSAGRDIQFMKRMNLPELKLKTFKGAVEEFKPFMTAFQTNIASKVDDEYEKLLYLMQHTEGKAHEVVATCAHLPPDQGYREAIKLLNRKYSNNTQTRSRLIEKLLDHPNLKADDVEGLDAYALHLRGTYNALQCIPDGMNDVGTRTMCQIVEKLPFGMIDRWRRVVDRIEEEERRSAELKDLVDMVEKEARVASHPSFGRHLLNQSKKDMKKSINVPLKRPIKTMTGSVRPAETAAESCSFCEKKHAVDTCEELGQKTEEDKKKFVMQKGLCFGCLAVGHRSKDCKRRKICEKCKMRHPTVLHRNPKDTEEVVTAGHVKTGEAPGAGRLQSVKVNVKYQGKTVSTRAFLDSGSTHSFISKQLVDTLGIKTEKKTSVILSTVNAEKKIESNLVTRIGIESQGGEQFMELPALYVLNSVPVKAEDFPNVQDVEEWTYLAEKGVEIEEMEPEENVGLLIGSNAAAVMEPLEVVPSQDGGPYAIRTRYGWILGGAEKVGSPAVRVNRIQVHYPVLQEEEFESCAGNRKGLSVEDVKWCLDVESSCCRKNGKYEIGLPFRTANPKQLPNSYGMAKQRLDALKKRFIKDPSFAASYKSQIQKLLDNDYAEKVPVSSQDKEDDEKWYLPHHGVYHPAKPGKLRVVFDCAARSNNVSLNDLLLQGPDLTNSLVDVLLRFRQEPVAFMGDIEAMFLQVGVPDRDRDYLTFLWWPEGDVDRQVEEFRMKVHLFGATSSPSCANYALHRTAEDFGADFDPQIAKTVRNNFYVDDVIKSAPSEEEAATLALDLKKLCVQGGFNLTKFSSNRVAVLKAIDQEDRASHVKEIDLRQDSLPVDRALGVLWDPQADELGFHIDVEAMKRKPVTRRGILSVTAACYDPLGMVSPYIIRGRMIGQELTRLRLGWDEQVPQEIGKDWVSWLSGLDQLTRFRVPRCVCQFGLAAAKIIELHHFSDASLRGFGTVSYVRTISHEDRVSCCLLTSRAHLAPIKAVSVPRLELNAAKLAVQVNEEVTRALEVKPTEVFYWTDSTTVLKYIHNDTTRYHVFVANRLAAIHDGSENDQWNYVPSQSNPADLVSRGVTDLLKNDIWTQGPAFLWEAKEQWPEWPGTQPVSEEDPEVKTFTVKSEETAVTAEDSQFQARSTSQVKPGAVAEQSDPLGDLIDHYSSWTKLKRAVAWIQKVIRELCLKKRGGSSRERRNLTISDLEASENLIIKRIQREAFPEELKNLECGRPVRLSSRIARLDPILDDGLLRVGGRLRNATLEWNAKHPLILPAKGSVVERIIFDTHKKTGHGGRQQVMFELRKRYWVVKANSGVRRCVGGCVSCRRRRHPPEVQKMADLPQDRLEQSEHPFFRTGVDYFGPFFVKRGRTKVKKYGVIFTCLAVRAVHIEVADSLSTDSFLKALRRFVARRGEVKVLRSDQGTNFVGAHRELKREVEHLIAGGRSIEQQLLDRGIDWKFNPPGASHHGGVWERLIREVRKTLEVLLEGSELTEETLHTLLCEVEAILNNRPLLPVSSDPRDDLPLTPNHILNLRCVRLPECDVTGADLCSPKKTWKQAAYLADQFWRRWRSEYIPVLQERPGPTTRSRSNIKVGDIVLMVDDQVPRGIWPLGCVEESFAGSDGRVRTIRVRSRGTTYLRPITKVVKITSHG